MSAIKKVTVRPARTLSLCLALVIGVSAIPCRAFDIVLPAAALRGDDFDSYGYDSGDGFIWSGQSGNSGCVSAPLSLVNGDEILGFAADLYDSDASYNFSLQLRRQSAVNPAASAETLATISTTSTTTVIQRLAAASISNPVVDTQNYIYFVTTSTCLQPLTYSHRIYSVRISTALLFEDGFESGGTAAWGAGPPGSLTGYYTLSLPGAAFFYTMGLGNFYEGWFDPAAGYLRPSEAGASGVNCDVAPVQLPDGATIAFLDAALYDNTSSKNLVIDFKRKRFTNSNVPEVLATLQTASATTNMQFPSTVPSVATIDNTLYAYYLETCTVGQLGLGHTLLRIYEVRFVYQR